MRMTAVNHICVEVRQDRRQPRSRSGKTDELEIRTWPGTRQRLELEVPNQDSGVGRRVLG
jgi:hypothetical protein